MKLLLTSNGIHDAAVAKALFDLMGKEARQTTVAFVPTASNIEDEDKCWLIDDLAQFRKQNFASLDIVDIAALEKSQWQARLEKVDVIVFGGGSTKYLVGVMRDISFDTQLKEWLSSKVIVGISAGSVMCGPVIRPTGETGLGFIDFVVVPHMGSPFFKRTKSDVEEFASTVHLPIYWLDDRAALSIEDSDIKHVGSGECLVVRPND